MVDYPTWTSVMHEAYRLEGGTYGSEQAAQVIVDVAAEVWNQHKEQILEMARDAAVQFAIEVVRRMILDA